MAKRIILTKNAPAAVGPYSQATLAGGFLFISGQIAIDPATGKVAGGSAADQARLILKNIGAILHEAGASYPDVVKCDVYVTDMTKFKAINEVYAEFFDDAPPARVTVQVAALPLGVDVEISATAHLGN